MRSQARYLRIMFRESTFRNSVGDFQEAVGGKRVQFEMDGPPKNTDLEVNHTQLLLNPTSTPTVSDSSAAINIMFY